ncbi:MAG: DUF805 domain-containing protein [Coriobacteriia bacterium]|nr:DUF805 domain-containing protein [Coriobacteriia bacterium]
MYSTSSSDLDALASSLSVFFGCFAIIGLIMFALYVWVFWRILSKAGFSGWLSLLNFVPFGMLALMLVLAFAKWPSQSAPQAAYYPATPAYVPPTSPTPPAYQPSPVASSTPPAPPAPPAPPMPPIEQ